MNIHLLFFGITTDVVGTNSSTYQLKDQATIEELKEVLVADFPGLKSIRKFAIAVNETYAEDSLVLSEGDIVAIIPPVSGG